MSSWSSAVTNLASLASKGDRNGCLKIIPTLQPHEINTIIDTTNDLTFLHRACQLDEQLIASALLQHGADISIQNKHGETGWTIACKAGFISILNVMIPFLQPHIPNILSDLVGSILPESEIISILHLLIHDQQSDWASSNQECVHLCVFLERFEILRVLLQLGFEESLRIPNRHGLSPLQVAEVRLIWVCTSDEQREKLRDISHQTFKETSRTRNESFSEESSASESETIASGSGSERISSSSHSSSSNSDQEEEDEEEEEEEEEEEGVSEDSGGGENLYRDDEDRHRHFFVQRLLRDYVRNHEIPEPNPIYEQIQSMSSLNNLFKIISYLTDLMGLESVILPPHGLTTSNGLATLIRRFGVFQLLDRLSQQYQLSPWTLSRFLEIPTPTNCSQDDINPAKLNISKRKSTAEISSVLNSLAGISGLGPNFHDFDPNWSYTDPGFCAEGVCDSIEPFVEIVVEAARIYMRYLRENEKSTTVEYNVSLLHEKICWYDLFSGYCSEKTSRALIWALASMHPKIRGKHLRAWAHILQDLSTFLFSECERELSIEETTNQFLTSPISEFSVNSISSYFSNRMYPVAPLDPPCRIRPTTTTTDQYNCYFIPDVRCDPFPGLSHPSVSALILERLATLGFSILYEITGQIVSDAGESLVGLEEELFDGLLELFLGVITPRLTAIHRQLCYEERFRVEMKKILNFQQKEKNQQKKKRKPLETIHLVQENLQIPKEIELIPCDLESHQVYKSSYGSQPVSALLKRGGVLYPHEWSLIQKNISGRKKDHVQMSLLRHITSILNSEILGLWHSVDQMLSLLLSPVDDGDRLALLFRSWYIWMLIDDTTCKPCSIIKLSRNTSSKSIPYFFKNKKVFIQQNSEYQLLASSLSIHPLDYHHIYNDKNEINFLQHGPDSFLRFFTTGLHYEKIPLLILELYINQQKSISNLMDSTPDNEYLYSHLYFILRTPWILSNSQRLDHVIFTIDEREEYLQNHENTSSTSNNNTKTNGYEIHLNRFTSPIIWGESILQQLLLDKYRTTKSTSLSIVYQGEAGIGQGPIKEFLDICRIFFSPRGITSQSLNEIVETNILSKDDDYTSTTQLVPTSVPDRSIPMIEEKKETIDQKISSVESEPTSNKRNKQRSRGRQGGLLMDIPLVSIFPLFRPAGPSYPNCIVPIELEIIAERITNLYLTHNRASTSMNTTPTSPSDENQKILTKSKKQNKKNQKGDNTNLDDSHQHDDQQHLSASFAPPPPTTGGSDGDGEKYSSEALHLAKKLFECIGLILGFCLLHSCPIGTSFPPYIWIKLLSQSASSSSHTPRPTTSSTPTTPAYNETTITWQTYCGHDERLLKSCQQILNFSSEELDSLQLPFIGQQYVWDIHQQVLSTKDIELLPSSSTRTGTRTGSKTNRRSGKGSSSGGGSNPIQDSPSYVNIDNRLRYINLFCKSRGLTPGILQSIQSIHIGLKRIISQDLLNILNPIHISEYLHGDTLINISLLQQHVNYGIGYSANHRIIKLFWYLVKNDLTEEERRQLLLFWTGSSIPIKGGYGVDEGDNDEMTIARKNSSHHGWLPEARTCEKRLYLPEYRTYEEMKRAIKNALQLGCIGFDKV